MIDTEVYLIPKVVHAEIALTISDSRFIVFEGLPALRGFFKGGRYLYPLKRSAVVVRYSPADRPLCRQEGDVFTTLATEDRYYG